ncbi:MAG: nuclear transport factor 2 family protein [Acidimicrobiia bacterium]
MECGLCGTLNRDLAGFCGGCGAPLGRVCSNCKSEIDAGLRFCDQCGTPVEGADAPAVSPAAAPNRAPDAVRKTVTVLFADLGGSTGFGERTDPEVARQVLARYHALLQEAIDAHGGTVAKFMGDGMMATFGIPEVAEDDAERAVRAGIEIQERFTRFAADVEAAHGETLTARVGVNTGEVVIGAGDADLVGDALNVAARLEHTCRPGHVLVGDETWRLTRGVLAYESLGEVTVAGRAQPVGTYEVASSEIAAETVAPFVGRDAELARLVAAFDRAYTERAAVLATVVGSPGLGKTRLSRELAARVSVDGGATAYEIRCDRSGGSTFAPVADLLREAAGLEDTEADTEGGVAQERLGALIRDDADRTRVVDALAGVLGVAPARSVEETFWAVRRTLESLAAERPLLVVIDDIQWAESKLLDLIDHLAEWVTDAPLLLVGLARPEIRELRPAFVEAGRRVADVVALDGLDSRATEALAAGLLGSALPRDLVERLPASTDGNPLFVRELVRMLVDDGVIRRRDDGTWELAIDAEAVEVPPTIQSLLATRVERLPADELRVLELASVVGAEFGVGALQALGGDDLALPTLLERLRRKELVEPTGTYWGDEPLHRFHHVLIRDAAYRRLLKGARADLHRRVGEWTDATAPTVIGEHETTIAFHYEQAHRYRTELGTLDDETDRLGRRAAELLDVAARRAFDRDDLASAGALASRALAVLPAADLAARSDLLLMACECLLASVAVAAGAPLVDDLTAVGADDPKLSAWADCFRAQLVALTDPEGLVDAEGVASRAAETLRELGDGAGEAKAHQVRALLLARLGRVGEAEAVLDLALGAARAADDRRRVTAVLGAAPQAALFGPSPVARAGGRCLDVVRLLRITTASPSVEATSMRCQAVLEALRGRFDVSRSMIASSRAALEELGLRHGLLETDLFAGIVELIAGDPAAAVAPLRAAYEGLGTLGVGADAGQAAALLATALLAQGETDEAELMAAESEALAGQNLKTAIAWRIAKASVLAARGDVEGGVTLAREAVEIASATDLVLDHADACVVLAGLRDTAGDAAGARAARDDARRLYEAKGATVPAEQLATTPREPVASPSTSTRERVSDRVPGVTRTPAADNAASRFMEQLRLAFNDSDSGALGQLLARDRVHDDRRSIVALVDVDDGGRLAEFAAASEQGFSFVEPEVIAVRGERLALTRMLARTSAGDESARLSVNELDADGRLAYSVLFDDDDLPGAMAELDRRYYVGEGAPFQRVLRALARYAAASDRDDFDALHEELAPDFVYVDRQRLGAGEGDRDYFTEFSRTRAAEGSLVNRAMYVNENALLAVQHARMTSDQGGVYERLACMVFCVDADDRISRVEVFELEEFDAALARFDEFASGYGARGRAPRAENLSTRVLDRWADLVVAGRLDEAAALFHPDVVRRDHTTLVSFPTVQGAEEYTDLIREVAADGYRSLRVAPIAVRGERLNLAHTTMRTSDGSETVSLYVNECDDDGLATYSAEYDEHDLIAAVDDLDVRYTAGEGAVDAEMLSHARTVMRAYDRHEWDALRSKLADDFVSVDHRTVGFGTVGPDEFIDLCRVGLEMMPDYVQICRTISVVGLAALGTFDGSGTLHDGGRYEWTIHFLQRLDPQGNVRRIEWFDETDLDAATARLRELGAPPPPSGPVLENAATAAIDRTLDMLPAGRWDDVRALYSDDFVRVDRRRVIGDGVVPGIDAQIENLRAIYTSTVEVEWTAIAVRGDRLVLARFEWLVDTFELTMLQVVGLDADGRCDLIAVFDEEDLDAALAALDERYLVAEGAEHLGVLVPCVRFRTASVDGDFDALRDLLAADFAFRDHRRLGFGSGDRDYYLAASRTRTEVAADGPIVNRLVVVEGNALLTLQTEQTNTPEGSEYERGAYVVMAVDGSGVIRAAEWFDDDREADARARLHELGAPRATGSGLENVATQDIERVLALLRQQRWDEVRPLYSDDFVRIDHRSVVNEGTVVGPDAMIESLRLVFTNSEEVEPSVVAVRGDRLALVRFRFLTNGFESVVLQVRSFDTDGRCDAIEIFDEDDLGVAIDALNARYFAGEGAEHAEMGARSTAWARAVQQRDWDAYAAMMADDFVAVSHFRFGFELGAAGFVDWLRATEAQTPGLTNVACRLEVVGRAVLSSNVVTGTTPEGNEYEWRLHLVSVADTHGRLARTEFFEDDEYATAVVRLHELGAPPSPVPLLENAAVRVDRAMSDLADHYLSTGAVTDDGQPEWRDDFVLEDRRAIVASGPQDRSGLGAMFAVMRDQGYVRATTTPIAVRGDRLCLSARVISTASGDASPTLAITELDEHGRYAANVIFDEQDLDAALAELDARFLAGEGAGSLPVLAAGQAWIEASRNRDVEVLGAVVAPDLVCVDHQPLGFGALDREGIIAATRLRFEVSSDDVVIVRSVQVDGPVLLARHYSETATDEGNRYQREAIYVLGVDADGRIDRWDVYGEGQSDAALARFRELAAPRAGPVVANAGSRTIERLLALLNAGDYEGISEVDGVAEHVVRYDRRNLVSAPPIQGAEAFAVNAIGFLDVFDTVDPEVVAVRGERLALVRLHFGRAPDFVLRLLCLYEFDSDGRIAWEADYDDEDLQVALRELDDRYVAGEGAAHERILRIGRAFADVNNERDFDATLAMLAPDFAMVDRTRRGFGAGDRDYFDAANRTRTELANDDAVVVRQVEVDGDALLAVIEGHRIRPDGSDSLWTSCIVFQIGDDERVRRAEYYDEDRYADATARLRELAHAEAVTTGPSAIENQATRVEREVTDRIARGESHLADLVAPDHRLEDRRGIVNLGDLDPAGQALNLALMREQGYLVGEPEPLAVRGERLCLSRRVARTVAGDESPILSVNELDESGRWSTMTFFDEDALDAAIDELDERYAAGEGADQAYTIRRTSDLRHAMTAHDWAAIEALVGDDFTFSDHRPIGLPAADRAGYVAAMVASAEQTPNAVMMGRALELRSDIALTRTRRVGATTEGFEYDWEQLAVSRWAAGLLRCVELFAVEDEAAARARVAELATQPLTPYVDNDAVRTVTRAYWLRRFVGTEAAGHLVSRQITGEDRRPTVSMPEFHGRAGFANAMDATDAVFSDGADIHPLAVRGERLALVRDRLRHGDDELEVLNLWETDEHGRLAHATLFDPDHLADAIDRLEDRHRELAGDAYTDFEMVAALGEHALNHRDFDTFAPMLAPGFQVVDHRQLGLPMDRRAYLDSMRVLIEQAPDFTFLFANPHIEGNVAITKVPFFGTTPEGNRYEWSYVQVAVGDPDAGLALAFDFFDDEQWEEAVARFRELVAGDSARTGDPRTPEPDNAAVRLIVDAAPLLWTDLDAALARFAPDASGVARESGIVTGLTIDDRGGWRELLASLAATYDELHVEPLAVRGDRLALLRQEFLADGYLTDGILLVELDDRGLICALRSFDESDLADAVEMLEAQYAELQGDAYTQAEAQMAEAERQINLGESGDLGRVLAAEFRITDRQQLGAWTFMDRRDYLESVRVFVEQTPARAFLFPKWHVLGDRAIAVTRSIGLTAEGSRYEWRNVQVLEIDTSGRAVRVELFPEGAWSEALTVFDEWSTDAVTAPVSEPDNAAVRVMRQLGRLAWTDLDAAAGLLAPDASGTTQQTGPMAGSSAFGRAEWRNVVASFVETYDEVHFEPLAVRGQRLALLRFEFVAQGFQSAALAVVRLDDADRIQRIETYDESDLARALVELNAWYRASGQATTAELDMLDVIDALNRRDWDAMTALLDPDLVAVDHQPLGFEPTDRDGFVGSWMGDLVAVMPGAVSVVAEVRGLGPAVFGRIMTRGDTVDGNAYEWDSLCVSRTGAGARLEFFPTDRRADALALLVEWGADPETGGPDNAAARAMVRWYGLSRDGASATADALIADDISMTDRRRSVSLPVIEGRTAFNDAMAATAELFADIEVRAVAVRGDEHALLHVLRANDGFELSTLVLVETVTGGLVRGVMIFDETALLDAIDELDARRLATATDLLPIEANQLRAYSALNHRSWPDLAASFDDDVTIVDHRRLGFPPGRGSEAIVGELQGLVLQVPDVIASVSEIRADGRVAIVTTHQRGTAAAGGEATWDFHTVVTIDPLARVTSLEYFDVDDLARAEQRFEECVAEQDEQRPTFTVENSVTRLLGELERRLRGGKPAEAAALVADVFDAVDHRHGVAAPDLTRSEDFIESLTAAGDVFDAVDHEPVAVRGEHLALVRWALRSDGFETTGYDVFERDESGRLCRCVTYDESDLVAALEALEQRYLARLGDAATPADRTAAAATIALNRREAQVFERLMVPEVSVVDHLPLNFPAASRSDQYVRMLLRLFELAPDTWFVVRKIDVVGSASLSVVEQHSTTTAGSSYLWVRNTVTRYVGDGRIEAQEYFPDDRWDDAVALFDEWSSRSDDPVDERAARLGDAVSEAFAARDWDTVCSLVSEDIRLDDRRSTVSSSPAQGREAVVALLQGFADVGFVTMRHELLEARSEQLALFRRTYRTVDGFELQMLAVFERDDAGLGVGMVLFDADDLDAATAELDRREGTIGV